LCTKRLKGGSRQIACPALAALQQMIAGQKPEPFASRPKTTASFGCGSEAPAQVPVGKIVAGGEPNGRPGNSSRLYRVLLLDAICASRADTLCRGSTVSESAIAAQLVPAAEIHWS
jgi:hypothetical protein